MTWTHTNGMGSVEVRTRNPRGYSITITPAGHTTPVPLDLANSHMRELAHALARAFGIKGVKVVETIPETITIKCPTCKGEGHVVPLAAPGLLTCSACQGAGEITGETKTP